MCSRKQVAERAIPAVVNGVGGMWPSPGQGGQFKQAQSKSGRLAGEPRAACPRRDHGNGSVCDANAAYACGPDQVQALIKSPSPRGLGPETILPVLQRIPSAATTSSVPSPWWGTSAAALPVTWV